ncbi:serine hydrolase [Rubrivirga sp.]|uniref:serine hydrolase n=1 Tax=Rubrivirga sp. TaxID=1885344 RepID=UPI003C75BC7A
MSHLSRLVGLVVLLSAVAHAQEARPLVLDASPSGALEAGDADRYTLDLEDDTFVSGAVMQLTVDVVVTVEGPNGQEIGQFDGPARGADAFQFTAETAGRYTITVAPFEDEAGDYTIALARLEPVATTPAGKVDQAMSRFDGDRPGALVAVLEGGNVVFERAYGMANLTHGVPMTLDTRTNIGSTSKQFTAMALALLDQRGDLDLDDDVRETVPELPDLGETVTIRNLLTHTSGYREFLNTLALTGRRIDKGSYIDRAEVVQMIQRQPAFQDEPGTVWNYNNSGYAIAATIVERVTGQGFPEWMAENVFGPLGMTDTVVRADPTVIVPNSAQGYLPGEDGQWRDAVDLYAAMGAGAIYTTVGDLGRWVRNFETAELGGPDVIREMTTPFVLEDGQATEYGLGLFVDELGGLRRVHHGGADNAHRSMLMYFPEIDAGVIVEFNGPDDATGFATRVARAFFEDRFVEDDGAADSDLEAADFDDDLFDDYAGRYALDIAPGFVLEFRRGDGGYLTQATGQGPLEILPTSDSTFVLTAVEAGVTFHRDADGVVRSATLHQNGDNRATKQDVEPMATAEPTDLGDYAGRYYSDELQVVYVLALEDGDLVTRVPGVADAFPSRLTTDDTVVVTAYGGFPITLDFDRDASGAITGFVADGGGRTRNVQFDVME